MRDNRAIYILKRWLFILLCALAGSVVTAYLGIYISDAAGAVLYRLTNGNPVAYCALSLASAFLLVSIVHSFAGFRLRHIRLNYPPLPFAVLIALGVAPLWPGFGHWGPPLMHPGTITCWAAAGIYLGIWIVGAGLGQWLRNWGEESKTAPAPKDAGQLAKLASLTDAQLKAWFEREAPIDMEEEDFFGFATFTERVWKRLDGGRNTIAIQGGFGAGKTSFINLLEKESKKNPGMPAWFVRVSCWAFEDSATAQKAVLTAITARLNEETDSFALRKMPKEYIELITKKVEWTAIFTPWKLDESPLEQLRRVTPILGALGAHVVVVIEDVDRMADQGQRDSILSLLAQFRAVEGLSFILTISPHQSLDFAKICEYMEILPVPSRETVGKICHRVRELLLNDTDYAADMKVNELAGAEVNYSALRWNDTNSPGENWQKSVAELLQAPRSLKHALRRTHEAWKLLHGEVSLDSLLMSSTLRTAAPSAFSFIVNESDQIRKVTAHQGPNRQKLIDDLNQRWKAIADPEGNIRQEFDPRPVSTILLNLFPETSVIFENGDDPVNQKQGLYGWRGGIYGRRIFSESMLPGENGDQPVLKLMVSKEEPETVKLANGIRDSMDTFDIFKYFSDASALQRPLPLLSKIYANLRAKEKNRAALGESAGSFEAWKTMNHKVTLPEFEQWLINEMLACIPGSLRLMTDIYRYWADMWVNDSDFCARARESIHRKCKEFFPAILRSTFIDGFDPTDTSTLSDLVFVDKNMEPPAPYGTVTDWEWLGPVIRNALSKNGKLMPHIIIALNAAKNDRATRRQGIKYTFDQELLTAWFGDETNKFMKDVANRELAFDTNLSFADSDLFGA